MDSGFLLGYIDYESIIQLVLYELYFFGPSTGEQSLNREKRCSNQHRANNSFWGILYEPTTIVNIYVMIRDPLGDR